MEPGEAFVYSFNLSRVYYGRRSNRAKRAVDLLRSLVARHAKVSPESVKILDDVNNYIWSRGIQRPPRRVKVLVRVIKDEEGNVKALVEIANKKLRPGKIELKEKSQ
ncbi:50S ribosomal protein L31e [Acidilobus saccharovorans]|uniref:50S ribosomal protein L31e n=1 Tax=Acidilobus saccharovorans TaxID=242703 RepID=UPI00066228BD|nr:50S ribosomal protein L31e [Acidilobus saccharovorans]